MSRVAFATKVEAPIQFLVCYKFVAKKRKNFLLEKGKCAMDSTEFGGLPVGLQEGLKKEEKIIIHLLE